MDVVLVMFKSDGKRQNFPLNKSKVIVGRKNNCDLRIPLSSVSRQHCEINLEEDQATIKDLGSSNGTFHNGNRIQESQLQPGDEITIGPVVFTVVIDGQPEQIEPVRTLIGDGDRVEGDQAGAKAADVEVTELPTDEGHDQLDEPIDPDSYSPTVDIDEDEDDDPIAALERLAESQNDDDEDEDD